MTPILPASRWRLDVATVRVLAVEAGVVSVATEAGSLFRLPAETFNRIAVPA